METPTTAPALCPCCSQTVTPKAQCQACGSPFTPSRAAQKYCGRICSKAQHRRIANNVKGLDKPYHHRPRSAASLAATAAKREQVLEDLTTITPSAPSPDIADYFAQIMAEVEADERADGLDEIERPPEDTPRPYAVPLPVPVKGPTWSPPRRLGQRNAKQARLHAAGIFTA